MKTVSVVMCTYNGEKYLREQLDSLAGQSYPVMELIIQDDGSNDETIEIINRYKERHPELNIRLYRNSINLGFNRNFFSAILKAKGDYIACCDQDDIWEACKLEMMIKNIGDASLIFHNSVLFNSNSVIGKLHNRPLCEFPSSINALMIPRSYGHQIMFRKDIQELLIPFATLNLSYDYFIYSLSGVTGRIRYIDTPLVRWRRHENASTYSEKKGEGKIHGYINAVKALFRTSNMNTTRIYFKLYSSIPVADKTARKLADKMSRINIVNFIGICYLCYKHRYELITECSGIKQSLRAFFVPLFFVRDYGQYILRK